MLLRGWPRPGPFFSLKSEPLFLEGCICFLTGNTQSCVPQCPPRTTRSLLGTTYRALAVSRARDRYLFYVIALIAATQQPYKGSPVVTLIL